VTKKGKKKSMFAGLKSGRTSPTKDVLEPVVPEEQKVFKMIDINLQIPKGKLVAIVGSVGSGKSSLVQVSLRAFNLGRDVR
jgi:ABC-type polysaccharide/polyol phosphate transport system ATPase subunit